MTQTMEYEIMHMEKVVATLSLQGVAEVINPPFMPYDLSLETDAADDIDTRLNNLVNFYHWCASRVLSLDREHAKAILNSIGFAQAVTDKERAEISLSYHCVSLTDVFWVRKKGEALTFAEINLYDQSLNEAIVDVALKGRQMTVTNRDLAPDLSTQGCFPKAWIRNATGFHLLKDGGADVVKRELLASKICRCFDIPQVAYQEYFYQGQLVTKSDLITSKKYSLVSKMAFDVYACNHDMETLEVCKGLDPQTFYGMNLLDYLIGNTDRHPENWGFLVDNETNQPVSLYPLMDFNQSFLAYDVLEGAMCLPLFPQRISQMEAALEAVKAIGLPQTADIEPAWFDGMEEEETMFRKRLDVLRRSILR